MPKIAGRQAFFLVAARVLAGKKKNASGVADVSFERSLRVPVDSATTVLGELLQAIAEQKGMWRGFALHIDLGDLRLPDVGYVAVPITLTVAKESEPRSVCDLVSLVEPADGVSDVPGPDGRRARPGIGESTIYLRGAYELPMQFFGRLLDAALTPHVARRSLGEFHRGDRRCVRGAGESARGRVRTLPFLRAQPSVSELRVQCAVVGGGPAGMMAAMLLARAGVRVALLEKHGDFLRDFRGDTIHPSTLEVMAELGLLESFLQRPHQEVTTLAGNLGDTLVTVADFTHLPTRCKFVAFMPQWEFLDFLAAEAKRHSELRPADAGARARPAVGGRPRRGRSRADAVGTRSTFAPT